MRVHITKDYYDGSRSKAADINLDGFSTAQLVYWLLDSSVASVTLTKRFDIQKAVKKLDAAPQQKD